MKKNILISLMAAALILVATSCTKKSDQTTTRSTLSGKVLIDGSSTVYPISLAVAEEFGKITEFKNIRVTVGQSGTGAGFKKFLRGETHINDASRVIKGKEKKIAEETGMKYIALPVAYDGISVVVKKDDKNAKVDSLTMTELQALWKSGSQVTTWNQIRSTFPAEQIKLYGPGTASGTFDYFTKVVNGESGASRSNYAASEDDNVIVNGVAASPFALGYFGYAYYLENKNTLRAIPIDEGKGKGAIAPDTQSIESGDYAFARPIFIYVSSKAVLEPQVETFVKYYIKNAQHLAEGYVPLSDAKTQEVMTTFENFVKEAKGTTAQAE